MQFILAANRSIKVALKKINSFYLVGALLGILLPISVLACPSSIPKGKDALDLWLYPVGMSWTVVFSLGSLPFFTSVFVESLFLYKREQLKYFKALITALYANIFALISWVIWILIYLFPSQDFSRSTISPGLITASGMIAVFFWAILWHFCEQTGCLVIFKNWKFYQQIPLIAAVSFGGWNILNFWLAGIVVSTPPPQYAGLDWHC
jgi:hypothetical protein